MAKPTTLKGRTEILAAIYDPDNLPSAILCAPNDNSTLYCLHSLRESDLSFFDAHFMAAMRNEQGLPDNGEKDDELQVLLYRFYEDYPTQKHKCHGCYYSTQINFIHAVSESEEACTKTCEECA